MKNRFLSGNARYVGALFGLILTAFVFGCQKMQTAEYRKFATDADVPRISILDAKKDYDAGNAIIVDSRPEAAYNVEHIAKSINIPLGSPDENKFSSLPKDKKIIVYCS
ncbi:hypothetical protein BH10ACI2_BH10ACI2_08200 [soil metagenome]